MKLIERVLVAVDLSPGSEKVLTAAENLAESFNSDLTLLNILPQPGDTSPEMQDLTEAVRESALNKMEQYKTRLVEKGARVSDAVTVVGNAFDWIIRFAEDLDVNLVVLATDHGVHGKTNHGMGITAERVCRKSTKPVWAVSGKPITELRNILCPIDWSAPSRRALKNSIHLARQFGAKLTVLHVTRQLQSLFGFDVSIDEFQKHRYFEKEKERLNEFISEFDFSGVDWDSRFEIGDPAEQIVATARKLDSELVIMGSVGRTGLTRILMGSVAANVIHDLPCSVIMMKADEAIRLRFDEELADIRDHYLQGIELLENGFPKEAKRQFEHCVRTNDMYLPAWEGLAQAYERLGDNEHAARCRATAKNLEEALSWKKIEAEIRSQHMLWTKLH